MYLVFATEVFLRRSVPVLTFKFESLELSIAYGQLIRIIELSNKTYLKYVGSHDYSDEN
jgi:hypothetical protein